jgi:hypothetical protein
MTIRRRKVRILGVVAALSLVALLNITPSAHAWDIPGSGNGHTWFVAPGPNDCHADISHWLNDGVLFQSWTDEPWSCTILGSRLHYMAYNGNYYYSSWVWHASRALAVVNAPYSPWSHHYICDGSCYYYNH